MSDVMLFGPLSDKDLRRQYPELASIAEFESLQNNELLFSWYMGNRTSPLLLDEDMPAELRLEIAIKKSFKGKLDAKARAEYLAWNFPERVRVAVRKMEEFRPDVRNRAKMMIEKIFTKFEEMIDVSEDDFILRNKDGVLMGVDWTSKKQYIDSCRNIAEAMPALITKLEEGFGIEVTDDKGDAPKGSKAIDRYLSQKKES